MSRVAYYLVFVVALILLLVAGVYTVIGATKIDNNPAYQNDSSLRSAHTYLTNASIACWASVGIAVAVLVATFLATGRSSSTALVATTLSGQLAQVTASGNRDQGISNLVLVAIVIVALLAFAVGVWAAMAASEMQKSPNFTDVGDDRSAYTAAVIAAVAGIGGVGALILSWIIYTAIKASMRRSEEATAQEIKNQITVKGKNAPANPAIKEKAD